jgi:hypothetical protein
MTFLPFLRFPVTPGAGKGFGDYDGTVKWLLIPAGIAVLGFAVDRLLLWMEWRGWIDYRRTNPGRISTGQVGPAFLAIQAVLEPGAAHQVEEQIAVRTEKEDVGEGAD